MKQGLNLCLYKRKGNPIITAYVQDDAARISLPLDEFKALLIGEIGSITWVVKNQTFKDRVDQAFDTIVRGIKEGATVIV